MAVRRALTSEAAAKQAAATVAQLQASFKAHDEALAADTCHAEEQVAILRCVIVPHKRCHKHLAANMVPKSQCLLTAAMIRITYVHYVTLQSAEMHHNQARAGGSNPIPDLDDDNRLHSQT